ncbi:class II histone deacetylase [Steroidobacter sp.]|uniref:class II histone deacetylase n=1 Tax=Steroidobacter sp. TaxID=1978227 RepID=UPI001A4F8F33|nr:class II histone deacetylase [Steroidobacter sp.]MBL8267385.1 class II histone deacetylase [Steroidobacter sp.]
MQETAWRTGFVFEELYLWHHTGAAAGVMPPGLAVEPGQHVESPEAKRRFRNLLEVSGLSDSLQRLRAEPVDESYLARFHTRDYIQCIKELSAAGGGDAGVLTPFGRGSFDIALLSAGGTRRAVEAVIAGQVRNAYALVRPPGHHAERDRGRGFCLFGNIALAAMHARAQLGVGRVAIVDWDVHHGNGTEQAFYEERDVLTVSTHQDRLFPRDSGDVASNGAGAGAGYNMNVPLPPGSGEGAYIAAFERVVIPALQRFKPELIMVASGFDAGGLDPMGRMQLHSDSYRRLTAILMAAANDLCNGRLVFSHEGGYSPWQAPYCGLAVMEELSGVRTRIVDPFLEMVQGWGQQGLQPHQSLAIDAAIPLLDRL